MKNNNKKFLKRKLKRDERIKAGLRKSSSSTSRRVNCYADAREQVEEIYRKRREAYAKLHQNPIEKMMLDALQGNQNNEKS